MPIPPGTKFHGVAPGVETENRGSASRNAERDAYTIEDFGGSSVFEYKGSTSASNVLTFTELPVPGDTITIAGVPITFTNGNPPAGANGIRCTPGIGLSVLIGLLRQFFENSQTTTQLYIETNPLVFGFNIEGDNNSLKIVAQANGSAGNSITTTSETSACSFSSPTLEGGVDGTQDVVEESNIYIKAVATERMSHGTVVYQVSFDTATSLPYVSDTSRSITGMVGYLGVGNRVPFGIAYDPDAGGSFNTILPGDVFTVLTFGIIKDVYVYTNERTGLRPSVGQTLCLVGTKIALGPYNGDGQPVATMLYPGTNSDFANDAIVFFHGGITSPYTRPTVDGVYNENSTRIYGTPLGSGVIDAGSLLAADDSGQQSGLLQQTAMPVRHFTSSDAAFDIVGISSNPNSNSRENSGVGVCVNGLVGNVTVYDATGAVVVTHEPGATTPLGTIVYAGDGTVNPSHVITTDPTSGIAVGRIAFDTLPGGLGQDVWTILFEPWRL